MELLAGEVVVRKDGERFAAKTHKTQPSDSVSPEIAAASDHEKIQGIWQITLVEDSGRIAPQGTFGGTTFSITKDALTSESDGRKSELTYRLDPSTTPKSIVLTEGDKTKLGIYDLEGDTLRICFSENRKGERPTVFDSKANSANDIVIMMKRLTSADKTPNVQTKELSPAAAMTLIPEAASISNEDLQKLMQTPDPRTVESQSLSLVLMTLDPLKQAKQNAAVRRDFGYLGAVQPDLSTLAKAMWTSRWKGYASLIQPEFITACQCKTSGGTATGTVAFEVFGVYRGAVEFTARRSDGSWRIEEFRLPNYGIKTVLGKDGKWNESPLDAQQKANEKIQDRKRSSTGYGKTRVWKPGTNEE